MTAYWLECAKTLRGNITNENTIPPFPALGERARGLFSYGYNFGFLKLEVRTKTSNGAEFSSYSEKDLEEKRIFGALETKYKIREYGLTLIEKWRSDTSLLSELICENVLNQDLKVALGVFFSPRSGETVITGKGDFNKQDRYRANVELENGPKGLTLKSSLVTKWMGLLGGIESKFDLRENRIIGLNLAAGYSDSDLILHANVNNGTEYGGSIFHKVTKELDIGFDVKWSSTSFDTKLTIGAQYKMDDDSSVRGKVTDSGNVAFGYEQKLREGLLVSLSAFVNVAKFETGDHKIGATIQFEA